MSIPFNPALIERADAALAAWDEACENVVGEFDAGDELAEVLGWFVRAIDNRCNFCGARLNADRTAHLPPHGEHEEPIE